jgi:hypothetical protein
MTNPSRPLTLADARLRALTILAETETRIQAERQRECDSPIAPCRSLPEEGVMSNISDELPQRGSGLPRLRPSVPERGTR